MDLMQCGLKSYMPNICAQGLSFPPLVPLRENSLDELLLMLNQTSLTDEQDKILWALENFKIFSTKSLYSFITNRGVMLKESGSIWNVRVPLKIKIFLW